MRPPKPKRSVETVPGDADHLVKTAQEASAPAAAAGHGPNAVTHNFKLPQPVKVGATLPSSCIMGSHALLPGGLTQAEHLEGLKICDSNDAAGKALAMHTSLHATTLLAHLGVRIHLGIIGQ